MTQKEKQVIQVLSRMIDMVKEEDFVEMFGYSLNRMLDTMFEDDEFGTEGQLDPRGDHRYLDCYDEDQDGDCNEYVDASVWDVIVE